MCVYTHKGRKVKKKNELVSFFYKSLIILFIFFALLDQKKRLDEHPVFNPRVGREHVAVIKGSITESPPRVRGTHHSDKGN